MNTDLQKAIKDAIQTEKDAMDFYKIGAAQMKNPDAKKVFELLAKEEAEHAGWFFSVYQGTEISSLEDFLAQAPNENSSWLGDLNKSIQSDFSERKAMELAMQKEQELEKNLRAAAEKVQDQAAKEIYLKNAQSTHNHYEVIESEYARIMRMVHETDIDTFVRE